MLEAVLSKCITHYLKEYVKPVDRDQMNLKVLEGKIKLLNLELIPTALTHHHIPFSVRKGCIKSINVVFPWKNFKDNACTVLIEDVSIALQFESEIIIKSDVHAGNSNIHLPSNSDDGSTQDTMRTISGLIESIIDNVRVLIKDIHIRIEFPSEPNPICIGLTIPEFSINTVDEKNNIITTIQHPLFVRKLLLIKDLSIYFDTIQEQIEIPDDSLFKTPAESVTAFAQLMQRLISSEHQYLFQPTTIRSLLIHTKDVKRPITNKIETTIDNISLSLDFHQCRSILRLNSIFRKFMKRRKYFNCNRPSPFSNFKNVWQYAHNCAIVKNTPHVFKPDLALTILTHRNAYTQLYRQAKVSKLSAGLLGSPKQKLQSLEKKVGRTATIYLREWADAICLKEESMKDQTDLTALDLSELKSVFKSTELVFSLQQLSGSAVIHSFSLELVYVKDSPLFAVKFENLYVNMDSLKQSIVMSVRIQDLSMFSYINDVSRNLFQTIHKPIGQSQRTRSDFVSATLTIPTAGQEVSSVVCSIAPIKVTLDAETFNNILEFFTIQNKRQLDIDDTKIKTVRLDIGEQLQGLHLLRNLKMSISMEKMEYAFPFNTDDDIKFLTFELSHLTFNKELNELLPKNIPEIPMSFKVTLKLDAKVDTFTLMASNDIKAIVQLVLYNGKFGVDLQADVNLSSLKVFAAEESFSVIYVAINHLLAIPFMQSGVISDSTQQVLMMGRSKMGCSVSLNDLTVYVDDKDVSNEMTIVVGDLNGSVNAYINQFSCDATLGTLSITQYNHIFVEILDQIQVKMDKQTYYDPLICNVQVESPHVFMNFNTIDWIMAFSNELINFLPKNIEPIHTPELHIKIDNDELSAPVISSSSLLNIDQLFESNASRFNRKKSTDSVVSVDSSGNDQGDLDDLNSVRLNFNVKNVLLEMIDESENGINSLFKIKEVSLSDPSDAGFILYINQFSISRFERYVLKPVDIKVPVFLPDPIEVSVDYAESEIFSGDINALNANSPKIFKLMFGGPTPLIKDPVEVNAFAKTGVGFIITENHDIVAKATVQEVHLYIKITSTELHVDVIVENAFGSYDEDNSFFFDIKDKFHCTYLGTMEYQNVAVEVPSADLILRHDILSWIVIYIPPDIPDPSTLQPLKIDLTVQPGQICFCSKTQKSYEKVLCMTIGTSKIFAYRDIVLDLDISMEEFRIMSKMIEMPILELGNFVIGMKKNVLTTTIPSFNVSISIPILMYILIEATSLIPKEATQLVASNSSSTVEFANIGVNLILQNISVSFYITTTSLLLLKIPYVKFLFNSYNNIGAIFIESISIFTQVRANEPSLVFNMSQIQSILGFLDNQDIDFTSFTMEEIEQLPQDGTVKKHYNLIYFSYQMSSISINYSHLFAQLIIDSTLDIMKQFNKFLTSEKKAKSKSEFEVSIKVNCIINEVKLSFIILKPFASIIFSGIKLDYQDNCNVSIENLTAVPITYQDGKEIQSIIGRSLITKKSEQENLLSVVLQSSECYVNLSDVDFYVNHELLLPLGQFILASPLLKLQKLLDDLEISLQKEQKEDSEINHLVTTESNQDDEVKSDEINLDKSSEQEIKETEKPNDSDSVNITLTDKIVDDSADSTNPKQSTQAENNQSNIPLENNLHFEQLNTSNENPIYSNHKEHQSNSEVTPNDPIVPNLIEQSGTNLIEQPAMNLDQNVDSESQSDQFEQEKTINSNNSSKHITFRGSDLSLVEEQNNIALVHSDSELKNVDVSQSSSQKSFSTALPFAMIVKLNNVSINIPVASEKEQLPELQIHITSFLSLEPSKITMNASSLSMNFYDVIKKISFTPFLFDFTLYFSLNIEEDSSFSFKTTLGLQSIISLADIQLFLRLGDTIQKVMGSLIFTFEDSSESPASVRFNTIDFFASQLTFILCKDNRSCARITPLFKFVIPQIAFKIERSENPNNLVEILRNVQPYLQYFNEITGKFDLLIEPLDIGLLAAMTQTQMTLHLNINSDIIINLPLGALVKVQNIVKEIKESLTNNENNFTDFPSMWICNKLGHNTQFIIGSDTFLLHHDRFIPIFNKDLNSTIAFSLHSMPFSISPMSFNYPTFLSYTILVVKKPYKGGMMISFERTVQVENNLSIPLDMFIFSLKQKRYMYSYTIMPHEREPLVFEKEINTMFVEKGRRKIEKNDPLTILIHDKSTTTFSILSKTGNYIPCVKRVFNDSTVGARIISINAQYVLYNLLPKTLYFKLTNVIHKVERGGKIDIDCIEKSTFTAYLSMDENLFLDSPTSIPIDYKSPKTIQLYNPETKQPLDGVLNCIYDKDTNQTTIEVHIPVVIYNTTSFYLILKEHDDVNHRSNDNASIELLPNSHKYWLPPSLNEKAPGDSLKLTMSVQNVGKQESEPFDCYNSGKKTLFLKSFQDDDLLITFRLNRSNYNKTSVLTISLLLTVVNNLDMPLTLIPIRKIPNEVNESHLDDLSRFCEKFNFPINVKPHSDMLVPLNPALGTFSFSLQGYRTSPALALFEQQKTVFRVQTPNSHFLIELQVVDCGNGITATFNNVTFPTPILINNQLDITILAFQLTCLTPFEISPHSTSIFAFDEPFGYPQVVLSLGLNILLKISLIEDTEKVKMRAEVNGQPVYVQVKHNKYGNRMVLITHECEEVYNSYKYFFACSIRGIAASLIDNQMREFILVYLARINCRVTKKDESIAISFTMKNLHIDDQNPLTSHPTIVHGCNTQTKPFLTFDCICPIDSLLFTSFDYLLLNVQRLDVAVSSSLISDCINLATSLNFDSVHSIHPTEETSKPSGNGLITFRWLEITPPYIVLKYRRKSTRPTMYGHMPSFFKFIPNIKSGKILLPGIVIARLTDRIDLMANKLSDDYKMAAFNQILAMFGSGGKILRGLGIASAIASALSIPMASDMTSELTSLNVIANTKKMRDSNSESGSGSSESSRYFALEFDNRVDDDLSSCFSSEAILNLIKKLFYTEIDDSPLIHLLSPKFAQIDSDKNDIQRAINGISEIKDPEKRKLIHHQIKKQIAAVQKAKNDAIKQAGLKLKLMPGFGFGRGIAGLLTSQLNDTIPTMSVMEGCNRMRETRPFPGGCISQFNPFVANAQKVIFQNCGINEIVKEISTSTTSRCSFLNEPKKVKKDVPIGYRYVIMTENSIYLFAKDLFTLLDSLKYAYFIDAQIERIDTSIWFTLKNGKAGEIVIDNQVGMNFFFSQIRMSEKFKESLILST